MEYIEISAKTVEEALTEASVKLGIPSSEIEYEVIEKGSTGFLGIGSKNAVIGLIMVLAAFMSLGNDLSFKPKTSFIKVLSLLLILGIASYLNNPLTIWGCIFTFIVVFGTTFTSHNLFGTDVYIPRSYEVPDHSTC